MIFLYEYLLTMTHSTVQACHVLYMGITIASRRYVCHGRSKIELFVLEPLKISPWLVMKRPCRIHMGNNWFMIRPPIDSSSYMERIEMIKMVTLELSNRERASPMHVTFVQDQIVSADANTPSNNLILSGHSVWVVCCHALAIKTKRHSICAILCLFFADVNYHQDKFLYPSTKWDWNV